MTTPTTKTVAISKPSALNVMASRLSVEPQKLTEALKATVFKNCTNEELLALVVVANTYNLNPFLKELYAFPSKGGGITPIVSVDGWNSLLLRQESFDGIEFEFAEGEDGVPVTCTATVYVKNRSKPVRITEYYSECVRNTDNWKNMPHRMLRNRTLCQASRMAFGFSGIVHEEEAPPAEVAAVVTTTPAALPPKTVATGEGKTPQADLEAFVVTAGFTFDTLQKFGVESGNIPGADSMASFSEVPSNVCERLLKAKTGLLKALEESKGM